MTYLLRMEIRGHGNFTNTSALGIRKRVHERSFCIPESTEEFVEVFGGELGREIGNSKCLTEQWIWSPSGIGNRFVGRTRKSPTTKLSSVVIVAVATGRFHHGIRH